MIKLQIGHVKIDSPVILAPMSGVTDLPFRGLVKRHGVGLVVSEMIASRAMVYNSKKTIRMITHSNEEQPIAIQLAGCDPKIMAEAAKLNEDQGASLIDINMGCPAKKVCGKAAGSALMRDTKKVSSILARVVNSVQVPVTLKIRTGWSLENKNAVDIARIAESEGITGLVVHGRTRACKFNGTAEHETAATIKQAVLIPVVANGDITSGAVAKNLFDNFGIDGLMIGRAARGNAWLFASVKAGLNDIPWVAPTLEERVGVMSDHLQGIHEHYGQQKGLLMARKHIGWYLDAFPNAPILRKMFNTILDIAEQQDFLHSIFNHVYAEVAA